MLIGNVFGEANSNLMPQNQIGSGNKNAWTKREVMQYAGEKFGGYAEQLLEEFGRVYPENHPADVLFMDYQERDGQLGLVNRRLELGADTWNWLFKRESPLGGGTAAWHCSEIPFLFHNASYIESAFEPGVSEELEDIMAGAWTAFARTGDPADCEKTKAWKKASKEEMTTMVFDRKCALRVNHDTHLRQLLKKAYTEKLKEETKWEN